MHSTRRATAAAVAFLVAATTVAGCDSGSTADASTVGARKPGCPAVLAEAKQAVKEAEDVNAPWGGPTTGPKAVPGRTIAYIAQTMTNPGVSGVARGVQEAAKVIGWDVRTIDGQGTPAGIREAFAEALALKPSGIVIGGFDPKSVTKQVEQADAAGIPLIGWHATATPGPSARPKLFSNVTTRVEDVARISADWIIARSGGRAGVVLFTDASIPFAARKSDLIRKHLATCPDVDLLSYEDIPIPEAGSRTLDKVASLQSRFGDRWTYSAAINDLYFDHAAPALRAAGHQGDGAPYNIGAGDGDPSAFERINGKRYQSATVPEPLSEQGWQIIDEFNRAFTGEPASDYVAPVHITTADNSGGALSWDSEGYRQAYRKIWGK
ncbi:MULTISPECIES: substrate-binding domain-containing protein [Streptomyces]|uniref:Substrate-binding domain-containing protein n=1 Tax=Streptomyces caniscabiei TaxID=2746961 RepID=A0ABU4MW81_9ACTN|nr:MULTISPECIES: substrate-binding domain-containing protein [Streptomyces]MBE4733445.1 substrate-binding domain-containing protein [Streptomyces caniscabiei]MBE4754623.1 substrate-binding domain-containing protein [Streptomyces caniscabiei]MBE4768556.1 substrate-binding domain-containing protein [Streptomyces caniscabiei]MBE4781940.1 substrate-binding domain-containing protein [Streptomyces caniscabiei]MBE4793230.1 substrate-binding domain-containing protein [Streptomyces caniscabiei]